MNLIRVWRNCVRYKHILFEFASLWLLGSKKIFKKKDEKPENYFLITFINFCKNEYSNYITYNYNWKKKKKQLNLNWASNFFYHYPWRASLRKQMKHSSCNCSQLSIRDGGFTFAKGSLLPAFGKQHQVHKKIPEKKMVLAGTYKW